MKLDSFSMSCQTATLAIIEIYHSGLGFPHQAESYDSRTQGPLELLGVATGTMNAGLNPNDTSITLTIPA